MLKSEFYTYLFSLANLCSKCDESRIGWIVEIIPLSGMHHMTILPVLLHLSPQKKPRLQYIVLNVLNCNVYSVTQVTDTVLYLFSR